MPVQSTVIACPAGQWTSIAQQMELRRSLLVQCPEAATTTNHSLVTLVVPPVVNNFLAANTLRKSFAVGANNGDCFISTDPTDFTVDGAIPHGIYLKENVTYVGNLLDLSVLGQAVQKAWYGYTNVNTMMIPLFEEIYTCRAVILGINTAGPTYTGPYGVVPVGIWASPDLAGGPAIFRLSRELDHELTIQEWFAWPVGSGTINVQVFQSFDLPAPRVIDDYATFDVGLPQLSKEGKIHLDNLRRRISAEQPDFSVAGEFRGGAERSVGPLGGTGLAGGGQ